MKFSIRKSLLGGLAAAALVTAAATPASAYCPGCWVGPGIAAGVIGGMALGAAAAANGPGPYYEGPGECWMERRPIYDEYGNFIGRRRVRVCH